MIRRMGGEKGNERCQKHHFIDAIVHQLLWNFSFFSLEEHLHSCRFSIAHQHTLNSFSLLPCLLWEMLTAR